MKQWTSTFISLLCITSSGAFAADQIFQSGPQQTTMVELYTSEGCNSCPPAESFLNGLADNKQLWKTFIPLAFHVDYWDYLGWQDKFASAANTRRQQTYGKVLHARTIYTPEFFVNGKEWRRGFFSNLPISSEKVGVLRVVRQDKQLNVSFEPERPMAAPLQLHVAVIGMGLKSDIGAGENAGRHTVHQFVVLAHKQLMNGKLQWQTSLPTATRLQPRRQGLVVWVSTPDSPAPLQATGGLLPL